MNKDRRKKLSAVIAKIEEAKTELEQIREEEQEAFDGIPEALQQGDKGQAMEEGISTIEQAEGELDSAIGSIQELAEG